MAAEPLSSLSRERVEGWVEREGDPTGVGVECSFPTAGSAPSAWVAGSWDRQGSELGRRWRVLCLVGPDGVVSLSPGTYDYWVRFTHDGEQVVRQVGALEVE